MIEVELYGGPRDGARFQLADDTEDDTPRELVFPLLPVAVWVADAPSGLVYTRSGERTPDGGALIYRVAMR